MLFSTKYIITNSFSFFFTLFWSHNLSLVTVLNLIFDAQDLISVVQLCNPNMCCMLLISVRKTFAEKFLKVFLLTQTPSLYLFALFATFFVFVRVLINLSTNVTLLFVNLMLNYLTPVYKVKVELILHKLLIFLIHDSLIIQSPFIHGPFIVHSTFIHHWFNIHSFIIHSLFIHHSFIFYS